MFSVGRMFLMLQRLRRKADKARRDDNLKQTAYALAFLVLLAGGFDIVSTNAALETGNIEGNPIVQFVLSITGQWWIVPKILFHFILACAILWLPSRQMIFSARLVVIGYIAIAVNNFYFAGIFVRAMAGVA